MAWLFIAGHFLILSGNVKWMRKVLNLGKTYRTEKAAKQFTHFISEDQRLQHVESLKNANYYSLMVDGATDSAVKEQELFFVRFANKGCIQTSFLSIENVEKGDAQHIFHVTAIAFKKGADLEMDDVYKKLVGFASGGASVMSGKKSGLVASLKEKQPLLIGVHCVNHKLELSYKDIFKKEAGFKEVDQLLMDLYYFYERSPLNRTNLRKSSEAAGMAKAAVIPTRVGGTRWVPHTERALTRLWSAYPAIVLHLSQVKEGSSRSVTVAAKAKAQGLYKTLTKKQLIVIGHFMLDIIAILSKLSLKFQERDCTIADVQHSLQGATDVLALYRDVPGPQLKQVLDCKEYKGYNLTGSGGPFNISATQARIVDSLTESLKQRFSDYDEGILSATSVISLSSWPKTKTDAKDFGNESIEMLAKCFQPILSSSSVSLNVIEPEWTYLKSLIYSRHKDSIDTLSWSQINREFGSLCRNILSLVDLLLSLPATSVECERGFSAMRMIKDDWRNQLNNETLIDLMRLVIHGPTVEEFDPTRAIDLWFKAGLRSRRPLSQEPSQSDSTDIIAEMVQERERMDPDVVTVSDDNDDDDDPCSAMALCD